MSTNVKLVIPWGLLTNLSFKLISQFNSDRRTGGQEDRRKKERRTGGQEDRRT